MNQQIGTAHELGVGDVVTVPAQVAACGERLVVWFVIGRVHDDRAVDLDPVAEGERGVVEVTGHDRGVVDAQDPLDEVMMLDVGGQLVDLDREVPVLHLSGEDLAEGTAQTTRAVDVPRVALHEQWREEWQTLNVVPVGVADQDVTIDRVTARRRDERLAETVSAGSAVDDQLRSRIGSNRHARGVATESHRGGSRLRDRSPCSPERHQHPRTSRRRLYGRSDSYGGDWT